MEDSPKKQTSKKRILFTAIAFALILAFILFQLDRVSGFFSFLFAVLSPLIYAIVFAFLINILVVKIRKLNRHWIKNEKVNKYFSITISYVLVLGLIVGLIFLVIPEIGRSLQEIQPKIAPFINSVEGYFNDLVNKFQLDANVIEKINEYITNLFSQVLSYLTNNIPQLVGYTLNIASAFWNIVFGLIISVYMVSGKEQLIRQSKKIITILVPEKYSVKTMETMTYANNIFRSYVGGEILASFILGVTVYIAMLIFQIPYALLNATIIMVTNLIPIVGPIIGAIPTTLIVLMVDPWKGVLCLLINVILQQVENNTIVPRIIGNSVGISSLWTLIAIVIGGGLFGVMGMVIAVPVMAVLYHLISEFIDEKYNHKYDDFVNRSSDPDDVTPPAEKQKKNANQ